MVHVMAFESDDPTVIWGEVQSRTIGLPGVLVALVLAAIGPAVYAALVRQRAGRRASAVTR